MNLRLENGFSLTDIHSSDKDAYVEHLREKQIYDQTLAIPYPYTAAHAEAWIEHIAEET